MQNEREKKLFIDEWKLNVTNQMTDYEIKVFL